MALMQSFPEFHLAVDAYSAKKPIPLLAKAVGVEFRNGGDLGRVVEVLKMNRRVEIDAATGSGKSTRLPIELARVTGKLVVHVMPQPLMAVGLQNFRDSTVHGVQCTMLRAVQDEWPSEGVVLASAGLVVAKWLSQGVEMPECFMLQDESHESGAASAVLRALAPSCSGIISYAAMTATHGPSGARRAEMSGTVHEQMYEPSSFSDPWSVDEEGAPWSVSDMTGHTMVIEDEPSRAAALVHAFNSCGAKAFRLHARMDEVEFISVLETLNDDRSAAICVLVADSSFRSSHTMKLSKVIDSGLVKRVVVGLDGRPVLSARPIYEYEAVQTKARGGRLQGLDSEYWRPRGYLEQKMCDLEQTDVEAAAAIFRALNFAVPRWAKEAKFAAGPVPARLYEALTGAVPLALLVSSQLTDPDVVPEQTSPLEAVEIPQDLVDPLVRSHDATPGFSEFASEATDFDSELREATDVLRGALQGTSSSRLPEFGDFFCASGVVSGDVRSLAFPDGDLSVRRVLDSDYSHTIHLGWNNFTRSVAVNALTNSYNRDLLEIKAYVAVLKQVREEPGIATEQMRDWIGRAAERLTACVGRAQATFGLIQRIAHEFCSLVQCGDLFQQEQSVLQDVILGSYRRAAPKCVDMRSGEVARMREWAESVTAKDHRSRTDFASAAVKGRIKSEVVPAARNYTGVNVPSYVSWFAGAKPLRSVTTSSSSSSSGVGSKRRGSVEIRRYLG